ncbi:hypothetical protein, partial [Klebsiella variicola]|uniref:hypothetical protein n=1 Tax=Klebsiella variicola TaxID=244366 RepID=UPI001952F341
MSTLPSHLLEQLQDQGVVQLQACALVDGVLGCGHGDRGVLHHALGQAVGHGQQVALAGSHG